MDLKAKIGIRLKQLRNERGLTQEQLAQSIDRSNDAISEFERGNTGTTLDLIEDICNSLQYPVSDLFDDVDQPAEISSEKHAYLFELLILLKRLPERDVKRALDLVRIATEK